MTRPVSFDADYKHGNVVERSFNPMKNWRALASRYDKDTRGQVSVDALRRQPPHRHPGS